MVLIHIEFRFGPVHLRRNHNERVYYICTVTSDRYRRLLEDHVVPPLRQRNCLANTVLMQDGATAHTARCARNAIQANFPDELVISITFQIAWPARSPELNPCDLDGGFLKDRVDHGHVTNEADLKAIIIRHVSPIPADMLWTTRWFAFSILLIDKVWA